MIFLLIDLIIKIISLRSSNCHSYIYYRIVLRVLTTNLNSINQIWGLFIHVIYLHQSLIIEATSAKHFNILSSCNMNRSFCSVIWSVIHVVFWCNLSSFSRVPCACETRSVVLCRARNRVACSCALIRKKMMNFSCW